MTTTAIAQTFTLEVANREYTEWKWIPSIRIPSIRIPSIRIPTIKSQDDTCDINPLEYKLFHGDVIAGAAAQAQASAAAQASGAVTQAIAAVSQIGISIKSSPVRAEHREICGVLVVEGNTYGRYNSSNKSGKLLYKCIPDNQHLPCFLVPYEEAKTGFSKTKINKYITFTFREWKDKHPLGIIANTFGDVDSLEAYSEYQMHCKELNASIKQLTAATLRVLRERSLGPIPLYCNEKPIEDRRDWTVFSIDPKGCTDIDDAIGFRDLFNGRSVLSIYISNVPLMLEYLGIWDYLTDRISTVYLPAKKVPMLPNALSDNMCSLQEKEDRVAFVLDVHITSGRISEVKCETVLIRVEKNFVYEAQELVEREDYQQMLAVVRELNQESIFYLQYVDNVRNSHEVVEFCMILMNHECSKMLKERQKGIFRAATNKDLQNNSDNDANEDDTNEDDTNQDDEEEEENNFHNLTPSFKQVVKSCVGEYCEYQQLKPHELIANGLPSYTHITSPIRRIVDCVNMLELQQDKFVWSAAAKQFSARWMSPAMIALINKKTRATRKIQNEMELLTLHYNLHAQRQSATVYAGMVFARTLCDSKDKQSEHKQSEHKQSEHKQSEHKQCNYKYRVYLPHLKMLTSITTSKKMHNYTMTEFTTHLFMAEDRLKKKIRLQLTE